MTMTDNYALFDGGIAALAHGADGGTAVHGVVIGEGDITLGISGKRVRWPAEVLRDLAELMAGKPITMADSLDPEQHVGVEATADGARITRNVAMDEKVGEILDAAFEDGVGLLFEGFLADWEAEEAVETGLAQTSPVLIIDGYEVVEEATDDEPALYEPTGVQAFRDLAIVADGAAPSNEINVGPAATAFPAATAEALASHFDAEVPTDEAGAVEAGADGGTDTPTGGGDDGPTGGEGQSTPADSRQYMTNDDLTDKQRELLAVAGQKDDPTVVEAEVLERLDALSDIEEQYEKHEELIEEAADMDDATVTSEAEIAAMQERIDIVEDMMAEALTDGHGLKEATVEAMSFEAMAAEFTDDESGEFSVEALTQSPEAGTGPSGNGSDGPTDEDLERIEAIDNKLDLTGSALPPERVEALQAEACELAGVDDYDAAVEVL